jgi:arabinogalactan oligomer/maltooligosaccharide transport system permease protein
MSTEKVSPSSEVLVPSEPAGAGGGGDGTEPVVAAAPRSSHARDWSAGFFAKLVLVALVDALGVYIVWQAWSVQAWGVMSAMLAAVIAVNVVYFARRSLPMKYILPGLIFLLMFQIYVVFYTGFIALTNWGDGHNVSKEQAVASLLEQNERRVEGSASYPLTVLLNGDEIGFAIVDEDGAVRAGSEEDPMTVVEDATVDNGRVTAVPGWDVASLNDIVARQSQITSLRVAYSDDPNDGSIRTQDAQTGFVFKPTLVYDDAANTMTDTVTGTVYHATDRGQFVSDDGTALATGWRVMVGFENFTTAFTDSRYAAPFVRILIWTLVFATLSVATTFLLGLLLAMVFNEERMRGRKIYRSLLLLPYAIPGFLSALIWSGLLNRRFGFINQVLLGGADIPWLTDPWLARLSVLGVNLWLGFPYMFLICTGALQSIPHDVREAAKVDGAGPFRFWRSVILPLLLISTAPLLISSFAFNFNNFTLIYMLTQGGPRFTDTSAPLGATDILISMVFRISGIDGSAAKDFGLASALSIVIFVIVATVSAIAFRQTRKLEEML